MNDIVANRFFRRDEVVVGPVNVVTHAGSLTRSKAKAFIAFGVQGVAKLVEKSAGNFKNIIANRVANLSNRKMKISHLTFGIQFVSNNYLMPKYIISAGFFFGPFFGI